MHLRQILAFGALFAVAFSGTVPGQTAPTAILAVDLENIAIYRQDTADATKYATNPNIVTPPAIRNFVPVIRLADIVAVNGKPAKGTWTVRGTLCSVAQRQVPETRSPTAVPRFSSTGCSTSGK